MKGDFFWGLRYVGLIALAALAFRLYTDYQSGKQTGSSNPGTGGENPPKVLNALY
jgi:uncharacterized membrane protein YebE (DUF533 family)